jgi:hypothetical protein
MSSSGGNLGGEPTFRWTLPAHRVASCWHVLDQRYQDAGFSAGLVSNLDPDKFYLRLDRDGEEPTMIFARGDEVLAIIWVLTGALWSAEFLIQPDEP